MHHSYGLQHILPCLSPGVKVNSCLIGSRHIRIDIRIRSRIEVGCSVSISPFRLDYARHLKMNSKTRNAIFKMPRDGGVIIFFFSLIISGYEFRLKSLPEICIPVYPYLLKLYPFSEIVLTRDMRGVFKYILLCGWSYYIVEVDNFPVLSGSVGLQP